MGQPRTVFHNQIDPERKYDDRFGTARRDEYQQKLPGEYNGQGERIDRNREMGLTPQPKWNEAFKPVAAQRDQQQVFRDGIAAAKRVQGASAGAVATPGGAVAHAANVASAVASQAAESSRAASEAGLPKIGDTRRTAFGTTETLMDSQSGPRWVGSVSGAPPATNFRPGDAGTNSLADHRVVGYTPPPSLRRDANGVPVDSPDQIDRANKAWLDSGMGKHTVSTSERVADQQVNSPAIQGMLDDAARSNSRTAFDAGLRLPASPAPNGVAKSVASPGGSAAVGSAGPVGNGGTDGAQAQKPRNTRPNPFVPAPAPTPAATTAYNVGESLREAPGKAADAAGDAIVSGAKAAGSAIDATVGPVEKAGRELWAGLTGSPPPVEREAGLVPDSGLRRGGGGPASMATVPRGRGIQPKGTAAAPVPVAPAAQIAAPSGLRRGGGGTAPRPVALPMGRVAAPVAPEQPTMTARQLFGHRPDQTAFDSAVQPIDPTKSERWNTMRRESINDALRAGLPRKENGSDQLQDAVQRSHAAGYSFPHFVGRENAPTGDRAPTRDMEGLVGALRRREADARASGQEATAQAVARERAYWENQLSRFGMSRDQWKQQTGEEDPRYPEEERASSSPTKGGSASSAHPTGRTAFDTYVRASKPAKPAPRRPDLVQKAAWA